MKKELELYSTMNRDLDNHNVEVLVKIWNEAIEAELRILKLIK